MVTKTEHPATSSLAPMADIDESSQGGVALGADARDMASPGSKGVSTSRSDLARRISEALSQAAIAAANEKYVTGGRGGFAGRDDNRTFGLIIRAIVIAFFAVPVFALTVYLAFIAKDQYVVESRFAVRAVSSAMGDFLSSMGANTGSTKSETAIVAKYLESETIVRSLDKDISLRSLYSGNHGDWFAQFDRDRPIEDLVKYWKWKISVDEESSSGLITTKVAAFRPEDALRISNAIIDKATILVNSLSEKNRQSVLDLAQQRLERARTKLSDVNVQMAQLRNSSGVLDSDAQGEAQLKLVSALELEMAKLQAKRASLSKLSSDSIQIRALEPQITSLQKQIDIEKAKLTGNSGDKKPLSGVMSDFDKMQVDHTVAQQEFVDAATSYEEARINAERQQIYLSVFMPPTLPESSTYPKRFLFWIIGVAAFAAITFALVAVARLIRDNRAA